jgi:hypothetical protein
VRSSVQSEWSVGTIWDPAKEHESFADLDLRPSRENEDLQLRKEASAMPKDKKKPEKKKEPTPEEESEEDVESVSYPACLCNFFCPHPWPLLVCSPAMAGTSHALCGIPWPQWGFT